MCGIFGVTKREQVPSGIDPNLQNSTLRHRGPDFHGTYEDANVHLSHFLLAIRGDISDSMQPVYTNNNPWVLVFNGQLYNTKTIRKILGANAPQTEVDTHLLYALIQKFGWGFISYIHGMFAIALYNKDEKIVRLYRDQSGQKNLYYTQLLDGRLVFSSEIKGVLTIREVKRTIDQLGLALATSIGYIPGSQTLLKNIYKVLPSEEVTFEIKTSVLRKKLYVSKGTEEYAGMSESEVFESVIRDHLQSKRDISINLSGGLDSSLIFYEAVRQGYTLHAYSTRFAGEHKTHNRDAELAERLARDYGQTFTPIHITQKSYLEHFTKAYTVIEEPNFNISLPIYYQTAVTEGISGDGLRVVLSGDGGDELFGGYDHYRTARRIGHYNTILTPTIVNLYKHLRDGKKLDYSKPSDMFYALRSFRKTWVVEDSDTVRKYLQSTTEPVCSLYKMQEQALYSLMLLDRFMWLASENFIRSDKLYMSQSMEMRCPLAYTPFRTYMDARIPNDAFINEKDNKLFLRKHYSSKLPDYITKRTDKTGWRAPVEHWYDTTYKSLFLDIINTNMQRDVGIHWSHLKKYVEEKETWPGKEVHLYLSVALILQSFGVDT